METKLINSATVLGNYNDIPTEISTQALVVTMLTGLTVTKSADKVIWADGTLTYTLEVDNQTDVVYTNPVITDILNPDLITLVQNSVKIDNVLVGSGDYTFDDSTGKLTINLPSIDAKTQKVVTFDVEKK